MQNNKFGHTADTMDIKTRPYARETDFDKVGQFLIRTYDTTADHVNWLGPRWEYMHYLKHSLIGEYDFSVIGIWETGGQIVAVVHPEEKMGLAYFEVAPDHSALKNDMLTYAEKHLHKCEDSAKVLTILINDRDDRFQCLATERGYVKQTWGEPMSHFIIPDPFPEITLPDGFRLKSLADDNDLVKVHTAMWRGFNHGDNPPADGIEHRRFMQSAPNFRKDLNIVVEAPTGQFVSYCGMWYEPVHRIAYVEPVATDPDYRRMGLASAAVLEGIRRCGQQGATVAYVGTNKRLYLSMGFQQIYNRSAWRREWT